MTKTAIAKNVARFVVGSSVSYITSSIVKNNVVPENALQKGELLVGSILIGVAASELASLWTDAKIDQIVHWYNTEVKK